MRTVQINPTFLDWQSTARSLLRDDVPPPEILWTEAGTNILFSPNDARESESSAPAASPAFRVPREFLPLAKSAACFRDDGRWALLYRVLWRLTHGEPHLLQIAVDDDVRRLLAMERSVGRDIHKMHAFVRFRKVTDDDAAGGLPGVVGGALAAERYVAFHRPDHFIVRQAAPFFAKRFATLRWTILTPDASADWDGHHLCFGPGVPASAAPRCDGLEELWRTYYAAIFNPARIKLDAMRRELPVRHWRTLPEASLIPELLADAPRRVEEMMKQARRNAATPSAAGKESPTTAGRVKKAAAAPAGDASACPSTGTAADFLPARRELPVLRDAAKGCQGCTLYCHATQVVFGEGPADAVIVFVGEQPGDSEDRAGQPFVGPAGQVLNDALELAGIDRSEAYVTNAVKHFKFEPRGTRRIHAKPSAREVGACRPWLEAELAAIKPRMIVCLGATAAQSLLGPAFRVTQHRGELQPTPHAPWLLATIHPSAILRIPDEAMREKARADFIDDLRVAAKQLKIEKAKLAERG